MEQIISKEELNRLMNIKGEVRGLALKSHGEFIVKEKDEQGLKELESKMMELGCPIDHKELGVMNFYPISTEAIALLMIKGLFNFDDQKFREMGIFSSKTSLIMKLFIKYFISINVMVKQASKMWKEYYTVGNLETVEFNKEKKYLVLRLENFNVHPLHCLHLEGYFSSIVKMIVKAPVICNETKCVHLGDRYHEFLLKW